MPDSSCRWSIAALFFIVFGIGSSQAAVPALVTKSGEWNQVVIPGDPAGGSLRSFFSDDLDVDTYQSRWIAWRYDASTALYEVVELDDPLIAGEGFWILQATDSDVALTLPEGLSNSVGSAQPGCPAGSNCLAVPTTTQIDSVSWKMLGAALDTPVDEGSFTFVRGAGTDCLSGCTIAESSNAGLTSSSLFWYDPDLGGYQDFTTTTILNPWQSAWFATAEDNLGANANARLLVSVDSGCSASGCGSIVVGDTRTKWHPLIIDVSGPAATETDDSPNPFLDIRLDITFTAPSGNEILVPGFFAGNGQGNGAGSVWRVRFSPDEAGIWSYNVSFERGEDIAVASLQGTGSGLDADGASGNFTVANASSSAPGLLADGRLEYIGDHYLKQRDGEYWIKGGVDSPENFFGYAGFDNTEDQSGGVDTSGLQDGLHRYAPHIDDWNNGDPYFVSEDTGVDSKGIIGAINYLSEQAVNSIYFLPMNLGGDGRDTYPFLGASGSDFDNTHYDVSKLYQWNIVLDHMQRKGISAHLVLAETESGNTDWLDGGQLGTERKLYYRELAARFSYLNAVKWNLSEESRYGTSRHISFANYIRSVDWADHQIAVHTQINQPANTYDDLLGILAFDTSSIQFSPGNADEYVETWRNKTSDAGVKWVIEMDEIGPAGTGLTDDNADSLRREVLYPTLFSGGHVEWYFGYHSLPLGGDMRTEDFSTRESMYQFMRYAREFMQQNLPFYDMSPNDDALSDGNSDDQVFEKPGDAYALYLQDGSAGRVLSVVAGNYSLRWFNPRNGQFSGATDSRSGSSISIGASPDSQSEDWVVLLTRN